MLPIFLLPAFLQLQVDPGPPARSRPPNVLVLIADDVGWEDLESVPMPQVDQLAARGLSFRGFHAMPLCAPTRVALWTGRWPRRMGVGDGVNSFAPPNPVGNPTPPSELVSLPKLLKQRGYRTCLVGKWHMGQASWVGSPNPEDIATGPHAHGFDHWLAGLPSNVNQGGSGYEDWFRVDDGDFTQNETDYATRAMRDAAVQWWTSTDGPKFLAVSLPAAHVPFHVPPPDMIPLWNPLVPIQSNTEMYQAMIQTVDTVLGDLLLHVGADDWVFFLSDNGTPSNVNGNRNTGKNTTYRRGVEVPLIVAGPGVRTLGEEVQALVSCADLYATIAAIAGTTPPGASTGLGGEDSVSFAGAFEQGRAWRGAREWVFGERFNLPGTLREEDIMVRTERWKLRIVRDPRPPDEEFLYDLLRDPDELFPLLEGDLNPDQREAYERLQRILARLPPR